MYDHLFGDVVEKGAARAVVRCGGVGYEVRISLNSAAELKVGATCQVFTLLHVVDGTPSLIGFASRAERELARRLLTVSSVGPSIALALLSAYSPSDLATHIARGATAALKAVKGVGQKTAERLCLELREAVLKLDIGTGDGSPHLVPNQSSDDALLALITLGYGEKDAREKLERVQRRPDATPRADTESLVRAVLQM